MDMSDKIGILAEAARYDASCSSGGSSRKASSKGFGNASTGGVCHSWSDDGRCISLLKLLMTNHCVYDCAYCYNRRSNDIPRSTFTPDEIVSLTVNFYKRNYIEGLFLSSGVIRNPDYTMEQMIRVAEKLRLGESFGGYIHLKTIPGASPELIRRAGLLADRISVNIELPSEQSLKKLAPDKKKDGILGPMAQIGRSIRENREERRRRRKIPAFAPAGQSTQMIIGASPESDLGILRLSDSLYWKYDLKRVYYSAYLPVGKEFVAPDRFAAPLLREHRLYQADWLMRFYGFDCGEILDERNPFLDEALDPKAAWALRNPQFFPVDVNRADERLLLRVPGIGVAGVKKILGSRRFARLRLEDLKKFGIALKRAQYFISCEGYASFANFESRLGEIHGRIVNDESKNIGLIQQELDFGQK